MTVLRRAARARHVRRRPGVFPTAMQDQAGSGDARPRMLLVCAKLGEPSETWLWRQVRGIERLSLRVATWKRSNPTSYPTEDRNVQVLNFPPAPWEGPGRWLYRLRNAPSGNFYASVGGERRALLRMAREDRPDVVLGHYGHVALRALPVARALGVPLVAHFNGTDLSSMLRNRWYEQSLVRALPHLAAAVVVSAAQAGALESRGYPRERIRRVPYGVPLDELAPCTTPEPDGGTGRCRFLAVGRLVEKKAPLVTLEAFARCVKEAPEAELVLIGEGPLQAAFRRLAAVLGVTGRVHMLGACDNERVRAELREANVFVQHSRTAPNGDTEGWPVAIAEAAACGLPIVSTRHASIPDQVEDGRTGFLVEENDVVGMGAAMARLARDPELRRSFGAAARAKAEREFDARVQIRALEDVLLDAARVFARRSEGFGQR